MMRILNLEPLGYSDQARNILQQIGTVTEQEMTREKLLEQVGSYEVLIVRLAHQIDRAVLDVATNLRVIVSATTGLDHIDVDYAQMRGVAVLSLRGETDFLRSIHATGEHTWAILLALLRHLPQVTAAVCEGEWNRDDYRGHELAGQTLGILGLGRIGCQVARYGQAFEMNVLAYDPYAGIWEPNIGHCDTLQALLRQAHIFSIHIPLNPLTQGLIGRDALNFLPRGAVLINTSRGEILDEDALVDALQSGHLAGAALDVIRSERQPNQRINSRLLNYARTQTNLLITPHIGGATWESMINTEIFMAKKLVRYLEER